MKLRFIFLTATAATIFLKPSAQADDQTSSAKTAAYQSGVSQEQLRGASQRLKKEMVELANEYSGYSAAAPEVEKLRSIINSLDHVTEKDMAQVAQALMSVSLDASPATLRGDLVNANSQQKDIQSILRGLADKLLQQSDEATMQKRFEDLAVRQSENLRATRELVAEADEDLPLRQAEQAAIQKEIGHTMDTLRKIARAAEPESAKHLAETLAAAESGNLEDQTKEATQAMQTTLPEAAVHQKIVLDRLQDMVAKLAEARTAEEQNRELAEAVRELAQKEESLANKTPKLNGQNQKQAKKGQQDVATRLDLLKGRIAKLNQVAGTEATSAIARSRELADQLSSSAADNARNLAATADGQKTLAGQLSAVSEILQKQADALAGANIPELAVPSMTPEEAAIQEAMSQLLEAKGNNALARRQNNQKQDFQERLAKAREGLTNASQKSSEAGQTVAASVEGFLTAAEKHASIAATGKEPEHNLYHVNANVDKALAALQEAANQLATADDKPQQPSDGEGNGNGTGGTGRGPGPRSNGMFTAGSAASEAQRDSLSLLKQEKAAPEYEPMINQYIKNLADDENTDR